MSEKIFITGKTFQCEYLNNAKIVIYYIIYYYSVYYYITLLHLC